MDHHYRLGDTGKREHIAQFATAFDNQMAIDSLKPNDPCFVRSGKWFTFAKVVSRGDRPEAELKILVDEDGSKFFFSYKFSVATQVLELTSQELGVVLYSKSMAWRELPALQPLFHWTVDQVR